MAVLQLQRQRQQYSIEICVEQNKSLYICFEIGNSRLKIFVFVEHAF